MVQCLTKEVQVQVPVKSVRNAYSAYMKDAPRLSYPTIIIYMFTSTPRKMVQLPFRLSWYNLYKKENGALSASLVLHIIYQAVASN